MENICTETASCRIKSNYYCRIVPKETASSAEIVVLVGVELFFKVNKKCSQRKQKVIQIKKNCSKYQTEKVPNVEASISLGVFDHECMVKVS